MQIPVVVQTPGLLTLSNVFMTVAQSEYVLQVPANRIGYAELSLAQRKIMQEAITLSVFVPFAMIYMNEPFELDYVWAALCLVGAVYFIFRT
ncbi:MAG: DMT family protein [Noviherbaspirillum sp.]